MRIFLILGRIVAGHDRHAPTPGPAPAPLQNPSEGVYERADVRALGAIDAGTRTEQEANGVQFMEDERGDITSTMVSTGSYVGDDDGSRSLDHRIRTTYVAPEATQIVIRPEP